MKRILFFLTVAVVISSPAARAQDTTECLIPPWKEVFPYFFCNILGDSGFLKGARNPWVDTMGIPWYNPSTSHIPGRVIVEPIDTSLDYQPDTGSRYPAAYLGDTYFNDLYSGDAYEDSIELGARNQATSDSALFIDSLPPAPPTELDPPDPEPDSTNYLTLEDPNDTLAMYAIGAYVDDPKDNPTYLADSDTYFTEYNDFYTADTSWQDVEEHYKKYVGAETQYTADSIAWINHVNPYDQVWVNAEASSDGQMGLMNWLALCGLTGDTSCYIIVKPNDSIVRWPGDYTKLNIKLAMTWGTGSYCRGDPYCPDTTRRFIIYNATNKFFYKNNTNLPNPDPTYALHPKAPLQGWFTGGLSPVGLTIPYNSSDFPFQQIVEHEIGHFLGMSHPDAVTLDSGVCSNNQTKCEDSLRKYMVMAGGLVTPGIDPHGLTPDDMAMFAKLYCPSNPLLSTVSEAPQPPDWFNPQVFPNPSNGGMTLTFDVNDRSFVQIGIYDMLGKEMNIVSSGYDEQGAQSLSLGTESLPSGNYVCRVRVGVRVDYINLVIKK